MAVCREVEFGLTELVPQSEAPSPAFEPGSVALLPAISVCWDEDVFSSWNRFGSGKLH